MTDRPVQRSRSARRGGGKPSSKASRSKRNPKPVQVAEPVTEPGVCICPVCGRTCKSKGGLASHVRAAHPAGAERMPPAPETVAAAVERSFTTIEVTPARAPLVATVRCLAAALDEAEPTDVSKISKELSARLTDLMLEASPHVDPDDWTKGSGPSKDRDTPKP